MKISIFASLGRTVGPAGPFFPSCLPGTLLNTATYAQALSHVASLKGEFGSNWRVLSPGEGGDWPVVLALFILAPQLTGLSSSPVNHSWGHGHRCLLAILLGFYIEFYMHVDVAVKGLRQRACPRGDCFESDHSMFKASPLPLQTF